MEATVAEYAVNGYTRERSGSYLPGIAPSNAYPCADGEIVIGANQDNLFARLASAIGHPEWADDPKFKTHRARGDNQTELDELISNWTRERTVAAVDQAMYEAAIPCGPIYRAKDMLDDPHYAARGSIVDVPHSQFHNLKMQNISPKFSSTPGRIRWAGPVELGSHNQEVYSEIGIEGKALQALADDGVI